MYYVYKYLVSFVFDDVFNSVNNKVTSLRIIVANITYKVVMLMI